MCVQRTSNYSQDLASLSLQCMGGSGCIIGAVRLLYSTIGGGGGGGLVVSCLSWIVSAHLLYEYFNGSGQSKVARHDVIWQLSDLRYIW